MPLKRCDAHCRLTAFLFPQDGIHPGISKCHSAFGGGQDSCSRSLLLAN